LQSEVLVDLSNTISLGMFYKEDEGLPEWGPSQLRLRFQVSNALQLVGGTR